MTRWIFSKTDFTSELVVGQNFKKWQKGLKTQKRVEPKPRNIDPFLSYFLKVKEFKKLDTFELSWVHLVNMRFVKTWNKIGKNPTVWRHQHIQHDDSFLSMYNNYDFSTFRALIWARISRKCLLCTKEPIDAKFSRFQPRNLDISDF